MTDDYQTVEPLVIDGLHLGQPYIISTHVFRGAEPVLVDPGPTSTLPNLEAGLAAHGMALADLRHILLTHIHLDHAGATGNILARYPQIQVYVHQRGAAHIINPERLMRSATRLYGDAMDRLWGEMLPVPETALTTLEGGEVLRLGERTVRVYDAPGHAPHHVIYFDETSGAACVGDNAGIRLPGQRYVSPATPPPDIDLEALEYTLDLIASLQPRMLLLTHFGRVDDPDEHIAAYRVQLRRWGDVVRMGLERGEDEATQIAHLLELEHAELTTTTDRNRYQQASPVALSWSGLARYWRKRAEQEGRDLA